MLRCFKSVIGVKFVCNGRNIRRKLTVYLSHHSPPHLFKKKKKKNEQQKQADGCAVTPGGQSPFPVHSLSCRVFKGCAWKKMFICMKKQNKSRRKFVHAVFFLGNRIFFCCVFLSATGAWTGIRLLPLFSSSVPPSAMLPSHCSAT